MDVNNLFTRHVRFMQHLKKYADRINTKYAAESMRKSLSYIFYGVSLAGENCRRRWPVPTTLALTMLLGK